MVCCAWDFHLDPCSSKDGLVKLWDLDTQHCFQTLVSHHREVWSIELVGGVSADDGVTSQRLVVASGGAELKVYKFSREDTEHSKVGGAGGVAIPECFLMQIPLVAVEIGTLRNSSNDRVTVLKADSTRQYLATLVSVQ